MWLQSDLQLLLCESRCRLLDPRRHADQQRHLQEDVPSSSGFRQLHASDDLVLDPVYRRHVRQRWWSVELGWVLYYLRVHGHVIPR